MKIRYYDEIDAIYFDFELSKRSVDQEELKDGIIIDYDENDTIIGIEILDFQRKVKNGLTPEELPFLEKDLPEMIYTFDLYKRMPYDDEIDYSDIPELTDEELERGVWINHRKQSFCYWLLLPLNNNHKFWKKHFKSNDNNEFWDYLSGQNIKLGSWFGYGKYQAKIYYQ